MLAPSSHRRGTTISDTDDFVASTIQRQVEAETAMHIGNAGPRPEMWSNQDPVTLFGALVSRSGCEDLRDTFGWLVASRCSYCSAYDVGRVTAGAIGQRPREPAEAAGPPLWPTAQTVLG